MPDMDGVENYITTIDRSGFFEVTTFSEDDLKRNEMYKKNALRAAEMASFGDYNDYLKSLEMHAVIDDFIPVYLARITCLSPPHNTAYKQEQPVQRDHPPLYARRNGKRI